jgi:hypothetical protein
MIGGGMLFGIKTKTPIQAHRYWRLLPTDVSWHNYSLSNKYFQAIFRFAMYASADGSGTDLCLAGTASAKSYYAAGYEASKANDNNGTTRWTTAQAADTNLNPQWWAIDLGSGISAEIKSVRMDGYYDGSSGELYAKSFALQYSDDNTNWTTKTTFNTAEAGLTSQLFQNL